MKIKVTDFAKRHFDPKFGGTRIKSHTVEEFEQKLEEINSVYVNMLDGYAPFCKLLVVKNFTNARTGTMEITMDNAQYLQTDYSARTDRELPVLSRFLQLPPMFKPPTAEYLVVVLYSEEKINEEIKERAFDNINPEEPFDDADWGVVAILGQMTNEEEPMNPITMMRNALGMSEGGSGVEIDREAYKKSVKFWSKNALVK